MKTLLLVSPPVLYGANWWANRIANKPHLASLSGVVRKLARVETLELDRVAGEDEATLLTQLDLLIESIPRGELGLVGISCWTSLHYLGAISVARRVRALRPEIPIAIGGHHATARPEDFSLETCDFLVRNDGENPLKQLCAEWPARPDAMRILEGGTYSQGNPDDIDWDDYGRPGERALWVGASRGCAFRCHFCVEPERGASYSRYEAEAQLDILERLVERRGPKVIAFSDPLFGSSRKWLEQFLGGLERRALPLMFWCETRVDLMTQELLEQLKRCRFMVDFGLDTASETMIARMEKAANPARYLQSAREIFAHANRLGLHHGVYLVFNFPGETPATAAETRAFIDSLHPEEGRHAGWLSAQTFFILPGTPAWNRRDWSAQFNGSRLYHPEWWKVRGDHYSLATAQLPHRDWQGREHELAAFVPWNQAVNARWSQAYSPEVSRFREQFYIG